MAGVMDGVADEGDNCVDNGEMGYDNDIDDQYDYEDMDFSDPDEFVDDVKDEELLQDVLNQRPKETDGFENVVIVDGIPQVGQDKLDKLKNVIRKLYSKFGKIVNEYFPDDSGKTKGYIFLEYSNAANALEAVTTTNGYKFDKQHTFAVNLFTDFDRYMNIPDVWVTPEPQSYKNPGNLKYYQQDPDCYDQYCMIHEGGEKTSIWLNSNPEPRVIEERDRWTETYVRWSPLGTYLCTFHQRGIALWGGEKFKQVMKFSHPGVQYIDFTPKETYLVTFSPEPGSKEDPQSIIVWDLRTGQEKRRFHCDQPPAIWPIFKWSHDDKYFSRLGSEGSISVYETPSFGLMDKKSMKIDGLKDFTWSPADNIIAYWVAESKNVPARVILIDIPSKNELQSKNLFNVADCKMHWQKTGDYLAVKVDRYARAKREKNEIKYSGLYYNFEIFHMRVKQIPVDIIEIKEPIVAFAWDPVGPCCAIVHGETNNVSVSFYGVLKRSVTLLKKYEKKACNHVFWSPAGQYIVLAGLRSLNGVFEFLDTKEWQVLGMGEHYTATDVEWDPTGRYFVTAVSYWAHNVDNAFYLWSWQGRIIHRNPVTKLSQFLWRPRPASLLNNDQIQEIKKNLKKYSVKFEARDRLSLSKASKELLEKRKTLLKEFEKYREEQIDVWESQRQRRLELRNNVDTDEFNTGENMDEEVVEFFIKEDITVVD